jgi:hypothetical protein
MVMSINDSHSPIEQLFNDNCLTEKIKIKLPYLFQLAELENSRAGKLGMEVGSARERIIVSLLTYKFGEENVKYNLPITEAEVDVKLYDNPISIKTITVKSANSLKLIWTVDALKALQFAKSYHPECAMLLVQINWEKEGGFYYITQEAQNKVLKDLGYENYMTLPKQGTNPRGVSISNIAMNQLITNQNTLSIAINWHKTKIDFKPLQRWINLWQEN